MDKADMTLTTSTTDADGEGGASPLRIHSEVNFPMQDAFR
jgi:hypothetical protein